MITKSGTATPQEDAKRDRVLDAAEFIDRLAEEMRATGGIDLPHSYYVEQVKICLAGHDLSDRDAANDAERIVRKVIGHPNSTVFHAWAMPDMQTP